MLKNPLVANLRHPIPHLGVEELIFDREVDLDQYVTTGSA